MVLNFIINCESFIANMAITAQNCFVRNPLPNGLFNVYLLDSPKPGYC